MKLIQSDFPAKSIDELSWSSPEGILVKPFYTSKDIGFAKPLLNESDWSIQQCISHSSIEKAKLLAKQAIENDTTDIRIDFNYSANGISGLPIQQKKDLIELLKYLIDSNTNFHFSGNGIQSTIFDYLDHPDIKISGSIQFDPFKDLLTQTTINFKHDDWLNTLSEFIASGKNFDRMKKLTINGTHFKSAAADCISEITFTLSTFIDYLDGLTDNGFTIEQLHNELSFNLAIGSNFFFEIAKLKAFRILVSQILTDYGFEGEQNIHICSTSSDWNKSSKDEYTNLLRSTTEAMSAILGGANRIEVLPFNSTNNYPTDFSLRLARNCQQMLKSESYFNIVNDASAGSYYVESLIIEITNKAWQRICQINDDGGFYQRLKSGVIQSELQKKREKVNDLIKKERIKLLGINSFNQNETHKKKEFETFPYSEQHLAKLKFYENPIQQLNIDRAEFNFEREVK